MAYTFDRRGKGAGPARVTQYFEDCWGRKSRDLS